MPNDPPARSRLTFHDYRIFFRGQDQGYDPCAATLAQVGDELWAAFVNAFEDDEAGHQPYLIRTRDRGQTWTKPVPLTPPVIKDPARESVFLTLNGPSLRGTVFANGHHIRLGEQATGRIFQNPAWRNYPTFIGRMERGATDFTYQWYPSGTWMGEQFVERGLVLPSGRLVFSIWGAKAPGENWRCGVLLSDDDGLTWRYRDVGYEPDLGIRDNPAVPAGFNEQTLFLTQQGYLVSIIRAREKLGRLADSRADTWFYRSESRDQGETWSAPQPTDVAGTGAGEVGLTLPDNSLLHACRVPYSRTLYHLPHPELFGLHLVRSCDGGQHWEPATFLQHDPEGNPFNNHYNAMNGQFVQVAADDWLYVFGQFDVAAKRHRLLAVGIRID